MNAELWSNIYFFEPPSPREGDHGVVEGVNKAQTNFNFSRREILRYAR